MSETLQPDFEQLANFESAATKRMVEVANVGEQEQNQPHAVVESTILPEVVNPDNKSKMASWRLRKSMEINSSIAKIGEVTGWEHFYDLKNSEHLNEGGQQRPLHPVIATTHHTDVDVQVTASLFAKVEDIGIASLQTNLENPVVGRLMSLAGKDNFFNISNSFEDGKMTVRLDAQNFLDMAKAVDERGKSMIVASYTPHYEGYGNKILPDTPGMAAVIVANLTDRVVLPVALEWQSDERFGMSSDKKGIGRRLTHGRPGVDVHISEPIFLDGPGIPEEYRTTKDEVLQALKVFSAETRSGMSKEERHAALDTLHKLKKQGETVLMAQAAELPPEAQGIWKERLEAEPVPELFEYDFEGSPRDTSTDLEVAA